jgi:putative phage-type endonuclease
MQVARKQNRVLLVRDGKNDADWLQLRRESGVGASESPTITGLSPYGSTVKIYGQKLGLLDADDETEVMRWGKKLEPLILDEYFDETGRKVLTTGVLLQSIEHPFLIATPDGEQEAEDHDGPGIVQVKNTGRVADWKEGPPLDVWAQMQHEMAVCGHAWGTAVALLDRGQLRWADVRRDDDYIEQTLIPRCSEFWRFVTERLPIPPHWIDARDETVEAILKMFPERAAGVTVELPGEFFDIHQRLREAVGEQELAEAAVETLKNRIRLAIGEASFGRLADGTTYSYKTHTRPVYDIPPHLKAKYERRVDVRPLLLLKKKGTVN